MACALASATLWWRSPVQPWFPALLVITVWLGGYWTRRLITRWHMLEFVVDSHARFEVRNPLGHKLDLSVTDTTGLELLEREVFGTALLHGPRHLGRTELILTRSNEQPIVVSAVRAHSQKNLRELANLVSQTMLGREPSVSQARTTQSQLSTGIPGDAVWLNAEPGYFAVLASTFLGAITAFAAFVLLAVGPSHEARVVDERDVAERVEQTRSSLGPAERFVGGSTDDVVIREDKCERNESWFWGEFHNVARLKADMEIPADEAALDRVRERLRAINRDDLPYEAIGSFQQNDDGLRVSVGLGDALALSTRTQCFDSNDRQILTDEMREILAAYAAWLTAPQP